MVVGTEWLVEAHGCSPEALRDLGRVKRVLEDVLARLELRAVGDGLFHTFPGEGGVTAMYLLTESHLTAHTYPEHRLATFNLYCCRPRPGYPWQDALATALGAETVTVRALPRGGDPG